MSLNILRKFSDRDKTKELKIAVFSPHADDAELGCGATLSRLLDNYRCIITSYVFITRNRSNAFNQISNERVIHCKKAFKYLITGASEINHEEQNSNNLNYSHKNNVGYLKLFPELNCELYLNESKIFELLRREKESHLSDVDIVFLPSNSEVHHDQNMLTKIASQIFVKDEQLLFYSTLERCGSQTKKFCPSIYIDASDFLRNDTIYQDIYKYSQESTYCDVKLKILSFFTEEKSKVWFDDAIFKSGMICNSSKAYMYKNKYTENLSEAFEGYVRL